MANKEIEIKKEFVGITLVLQQKVFMLKTEERLFSLTFFSPKQKVVLQCCLAIPLKGEKPLVSNNVSVCRELYKWGPWRRVSSTHYESVIRESGSLVVHQDDCHCPLCLFSSVVRSGVQTERHNKAQ